MANQFRWTFCDGSQDMGAISTKVFDEKGICKINLEAWTNHPVNVNERLCVNQDSSFIEIQEPPRLIEFDVNTHRACGPVSLALSNLSIGDSLDYIWRNGDAPFSFEEHPDSIVLLPGIADTVYTIILESNNLCGGNETMEQIEVLAQAKAQYGVTFERPCSGDTLLLHNISTGSPDSVYWELSNGLNFTQFDPPPIIPFTDTLPTMLLVKLIAQNQCNIDSIEREVIVNPTNVRALINQSDQELCLGDTLTVEAFTTPGAPFHWEFGDGNTFTSKIIKHVFQEVDSFQITLYTSGCGFDSMNAQIRVLPLPTIDLSLDNTVCATSEANFSVMTNAEGHQLFYGDGDSTNLSIGTHIYETAGSYPINIQATDLNGCQQLKTDSILVKPLPIPIISRVSDSLCAGELGIFQSISENIENCQWKFGDNNFSQGCQVEHTYQTSNDFEITLIASNQECMDSTSTTVFVRETPIAAYQVEIIEACTPAKVLLKNESIDATGIEWQLPNGSTNSTVEFEAILQNGGQQTIQLIATNDGICFDTTSQTFTTFQTPHINLQLDENCTKDEGTDLMINTTPESFTRLIQGQDTLEGTFFPGLLVDDYEIKVVSDEGCQGDTTIFIKEIQELSIEVTPDSQTIDLGNAAIIEVLSNISNVTYQWLPAEDIIGNDERIIGVFPNQPQDYEVIVTDNNTGCTQLAKAFVNVKIDRNKAIYFPNAFSPDGSLNNDVFRIRINTPAVKEVIYFEVFDKNGAKVFEAKNYEPKAEVGEWDGNFKGEKAELGIYIYQARLLYTDNHEENFKGGVLLIR